MKMSNPDAYGCIALRAGRSPIVQELLDISAGEGPNQARKVLAVNLTADTILLTPQQVFELAFRLNSWLHTDSLALHLVAGGRIPPRSNLKVTVFLNGEDVSNQAVEACEAEGWVDVFQGSHGNRPRWPQDPYAYAHDTGRLSTYRRFGSVSITVTPRPLAQSSSLTVSHNRDGSITYTWDTTGRDQIPTCAPLLPLPQPGDPYPPDAPDVAAVEITYTPAGDVYRRSLIRLNSSPRTGTTEGDSHLEATPYERLLECPGYVESATGHFEPATALDPDTCAGCGLHRAKHVPPLSRS